MARQAPWDGLDLRILLDSHVFLWWIDDPERIATPVRDAIADGRNDVHLSLASVWELAIKIGAGKLAVPIPLAEMVQRSEIPVLPIAFDHVIAAGALPPHHRDPIDRLMVSQALAEGLTVATRDPVFSKYGIAVMAA